MNYKLAGKPITNLEPKAVVREILRSRGIINVDEFLSPSEEHLITPAALDNIGWGAELLMKHLAEKNKIFIQVDSDVDGYTSAALLYLYIKEMDPDADIEYRVHDGKQHGVIVDTVPEDCSLVILPDSGSSQYKEHKQLLDKNIHVLVLDHHETDEVSEDAIVINNQIGNYMNKALSGVGVVHKFCKFLDMCHKTDYADYYMDLVAVGLIADMMDLRELENRWYVTKGLQELNNPFLREIARKNAYSIGPKLTPKGVAFYIAPLINGVVRMGTQEEKEMMFEAFILGDEAIQSKKRGAKPGDFVARATEMARIAGNVKNKQKRVTDKVVEEVEGLIKSRNLLDNKVIVVEVDKDTVPQVLTGLVANKLMAKYKKPVLILRRTKDGMLQGSGRNHDKNDLDNFKEFLQETELFLYAEGHASAFGAGIKADDLERFFEVSNEILSSMSFDNSTYEVDLILSKVELTQELLSGIGELEEVWGKGVEQPLIALENITVPSNKIILMSPDKRPTLKFLINGTPVIKFGSSMEEYEELTKHEDGGVVINLVGKPVRNEWNGRVTYQMLADEYEVVSFKEVIF